MIKKFSLLVIRYEQNFGNCYIYSIFLNIFMQGKGFKIILIYIYIYKYCRHISFIFFLPTISVLTTKTIRGVVKNILV